MQDTLETIKPFRGWTKPSLAIISSFIERMVKAEIPRYMQYSVSAAILLFTFMFGWLLHDEFHLSSVLLCLVASIFISLVTDLRISLLSSVLSAIAADYFFIGPAGSIQVDFHFIVRATVFLGTSVGANLLVGTLRRSYIDSVASGRAAEQANHEKDELMAILAHDLRSPLTSVLLSLQMIERALPSSADSQQVLKHCLRAKESCQRLNSLVLDLLDSSKVEHKGLPIQRENCDLTALIAALGTELKIQAVQAGILFEFSAGNTETFAFCDRNRMTQLVTNLVSNAFKFTPKGGRVSLTLDHEPGFARITVADTGQGMSENQLTHMFERFWQAKRTGRTGVGLGLYIVKAIVDAHRGHIEVTSQPGQGTTFVVEIPLGD